MGSPIYNGKRKVGPMLLPPHQHPSISSKMTSRCGDLREQLSQVQWWWQDEDNRQPFLAVQNNRCGTRPDHQHDALFSF